MLGKLPAGSRVPIYIPSTESVSVQIPSNTDISSSFTCPPLIQPPHHQTDLNVLEKQAQEKEQSTNNNNNMPKVINNLYQYLNNYTINK